MLMYQIRPSESAATLRDILKIRKITDELHPVARRRLARHGVILNWGNSHAAPHLMEKRWINPPDKVALAVSKFQSLTKLKAADVPCVEVTGDPDVAEQWAAKGRCLTRRDGLSGGAGIEHRFRLDMPLHGFYAKVFPKTHEFRVHVFRGHAIDFTEKKARVGANVNRLIRSYDNGWIFAHENLSVTPADKAELEELAIEAIEALELDFGAVDLLAILNKENPRGLKKARVCEVNTAPGLENTATIDAYVAAIRSLEE
jgi:hypothetical protein